jgi:hypothetical protein
MTGGIDVLMLIVGVMALIKGRIPLPRKRAVAGAWGRLIGAILVLPIPLTFLASFTMLLWMAAAGKPLEVRALPTPVLVIHAACTFICLAIAMVATLATNRPAPPRVMTQKAKLGTGKTGWYPCPHCDGPGIPVWRKAFLDPIYATTCRICGQEVAVPYLKSILAAVPLIAVLVLPTFFVPVGSLLEQTAVGQLTRALVFWCVATVIGAAISVYLSLHWVPLVPR